MLLPGVPNHLRDPRAGHRGEPQAPVSAMRPRVAPGRFGIRDRQRRNPRRYPAANSPAHSPARSGTTPTAHAHNGHSHQRRPGRPTVPDFARLCWMDDRSAERFAAYKLGRGAEYDDKSAAREDLRKKRGLPAVAPRGSKLFASRADGRAQKGRTSQESRENAASPAHPIPHRDSPARGLTSIHRDASGLLRTRPDRRLISAVASVLLNERVPHQVMQSRRPLVGRVMPKHIEHPAAQFASCRRAILVLHGD